MQNKIKISQKEFDDIYQIEEIRESKAKEITEENPDLPSAKQDDTTPFLTEEEEEHDRILFENLPDIEEEV